MKDIKKEKVIFIFKLVLSGAEFANPSLWCSDILTPIGRNIKNKMDYVGFIGLVLYCIFVYIIVDRL